MSKVCRPAWGPGAICRLLWAPGSHGHRARCTHLTHLVQHHSPGATRHPGVTASLWGGLNLGESPPCEPPRSCLCQPHGQCGLELELGSWGEVGSGKNREPRFPEGPQQPLVRKKGGVFPPAPFHIQSRGLHLTVWAKTILRLKTLTT